MRLDKFLWCVRYFKTRKISDEVIGKNRVRVNGVISKSSKTVGVGDEIVVRKNQIDYRFEIIQVPKSRMNAKKVGMFIKDLTSKKDLEEIKQRRNDQNYYRAKGEGRPTKKDRRDLDDFMKGEES